MIAGGSVHLSVRLSDGRMDENTRLKNIMFCCCKTSAAANAAAAAAVAASDDDDGCH